MLLSFRVGYVIRGNKGRLNRSYNFAETVTAEISETTESEAPVAVSWHTPKNLSPFPMPTYAHLRASDETGRQFTRFYEGRHWLRLVEGHISQSYSITPELTGAAFAHGLAEGRGFDILGMARNAPGVHKRVEGDPSSQFASTTVNTREHAMRKLDLAFSDLLLVDGVLHVACAQPAICMTDALGESDDTCVLYVETRKEFTDGSQKRHLVYSLDGWEDASAMVVRGSMNRARTEANLSDLAPTVHLPFSIDPEVVAKRTADTLVKQFLNETSHVSTGVSGYFLLEGALAREEFLRGTIAESRHEWEIAGLPVELLDLADQAFTDGSSIDIGITLSVPKPF